MRRAVRVSAWVGVLGAAVFVCCALLPRYPSAAPRNTVWPEEKLEESMNPWFLGEGFSDRIEIEVDWVAGCRPGPHTLKGLRKIAEKYAPAGVPVSVVLDDEIPRAEWDATTKAPRLSGTASDRVDPLVRDHADFAREPCDPEFRTAHFYVLFAPGTGKWFFGYGSAWYPQDGAGTTPVNVIVVFHEAHARLAKLWLSCDRMEAMTVVHEYGHQLGLVANKAHERMNPAFDHCTSLSCLMAQPTWRVYAHNALPGLFNHFPSDYCDRCQEDIRRAQAGWRAHLLKDPSYRARRASDLQAWYWSLSIRPLVGRGDYEAGLAEIGEARRRYPDSGSFTFDEIRALTALGRFDDAAARLKSADPDRRVSLTWTLARALARMGRYEEAIALFDLETIRKLDEYEFEQSSFILIDALDKAGRFDEAVSLTDEMLAREPAMAYGQERRRASRAELLLRAGRVPEALAAVEKGLGSRKTRPVWYSTGATVYEAAGRESDARELLREWLDVEETGRAKPGDGGRDSKWRRSWTIAGIHARLGDEPSARAAIEKAGAPPEGTSIDSVLWGEVPVLAKLQDWDPAAALIRTREPGTFFDVCGNRDISPMRSDPRFADLFTKCAAVSPPTANAAAGSAH